MELKKMEKIAIVHNGKPILAYTIQTINEAYNFPKSVGALGWFTIVAQDGMTTRHYCPCDVFEREIAAITENTSPKNVLRGKGGRPSNEERLMRIEFKLDTLIKMRSN